MRVIHLITRFNQGGTAQWLRYLTEGLESSGVDVIIATGRAVAPEVEDQWLLKSCFIKIKSLSKSSGLVNDFRAFLEIRKLILDKKPDVLNTHTSKAGVLGRLASMSIRKQSRPYIVHTFHGHLLYGYFGRVGSWIVATIERSFSRTTDHFIISGQKVAKELLRAKIVRMGAFTCVTPGLPHHDLPSRGTSRDFFNLNDHDFVVGWLGRLTDIKDPGMLLEIASELPQIIFLMGGEGELKEFLLQNATENVRILGWVPQDMFWSACDVAILTSKNEAQPYSLIEAIHSGKVILARNVGSVQDVVNQGHFGFLFENTNEAVLRLQSLQANSKLVLEMSESAKKAALKNFSLENFVCAHINVYQNSSHRRKSLDV